IEALREALPDNPRWAVTVRHGVLLMRYLGTSRNEAWALCEHAWQLLRPRWIEREAHTPRIWLT
ncbi:MAG: urease accessory protein UreD, partial [Pseudomonadota bacterium]|nr:urease accessory protein UreD [Pseudomonadota bacterium]